MECDRFGADGKSAHAPLAVDVQQVPVVKEKPENQPHDAADQVRSA